MDLKSLCIFFFFSVFYSDEASQIFFIFLFAMSAFVSFCLGFIYVWGFEVGLPYFDSSRGLCSGPLATLLCFGAGLGSRIYILRNLANNNNDDYK